MYGMKIENLDAGFSEFKFPYGGVRAESNFGFYIIFVLTGLPACNPSLNRALPCRV